MRHRLVFKNKKRTMIRLAILLLIPILIAVIVLIATKFAKRSAVLTELTELPLFDTANFAYSGSGVLYVSADKLCYTDFSDKSKDYSLAVGDTNISLAASRGMSLLYNDSAVQIIGSQKPVEIPGSLISVKCASSYAAALWQDADKNVTLQIFNSDAQVDQIEFKDSFLVDFGFTSVNENVLWALTLDVGSAIPVSTLTTYDMDKNTTTGVMTIQGQLVEHILFSGNSIFTVSTNNLTRYNAVGNTQAYRLLVYGWNMLDYSASATSPVFLFAPRDGKPLSTVKLYTVAEGETADEQVVALQLPMGVLKVFLSNGKLIACSPDTVYIYSSTGVLTSSVPLGIVADDFIKLSDSHVIVKNASGMYLMTLR